MSAITGTSSAVELRGPVEGRAGEVLTPDALAFVAALQRRFSAERERLLAARAVRRLG